MDSDLSGGQRYPPFEQLRPGLLNTCIERRASRSIFALIQYTEPPTEPSEHLYQLKKAVISDSCYLIVILTVTPLECNSFDACIMAIPY